MKRITACFLMLALLGTLKAQQIVNSVNHKISGKAAAGEWVDYSILPEKDRISFTFETKKTKNKAKYEHYSFGMDLSFGGMKEEELEPVVAEKKFADADTRETIKLNRNNRILRVGKNLITGQMVMERGKIQYSYAGRALITKFNTEQKVKPKGDDGAKLLLVHSRTEEPLKLGTARKNYFGQGRATNQITATTGSLRQNSIDVGNVSALVYDKSGAPFEKYAFLIYDAHTLTRKLTKEITFGKAYRPIYARDMPNGDMAFIFAPMMEVDLGKSPMAAKMSLHSGPAMFKYYRINLKGEKVDEVDFELPKTKLGVPYELGIIPSQHDEMTVYVVGGGNPDFLGMGVKEVAASFASTHGNHMKVAGTPKSAKVVLGKMGNGKLQYLKLHAPENIFSKAQTPKGSKVKIPEGKNAGKFFTYDSPRILEATHMEGADFITGHGAANGYLFVLQLDSKGDVQHIYLENRGKVYFIEGAILTSSNNEKYLLLSHQPKGKTDGENQENNFKRSIESIKLTPGAGEISAPKRLLPAKTFVDQVNPIYFLSKDEAVVLGHTSRKDVTISKVKF